MPITKAEKARRSYYRHKARMASDLEYVENYDRKRAQQREWRKERTLKDPEYRDRVLKLSRKLYYKNREKILEKERFAYHNNGGKARNRKQKDKRKFGNFAEAHRDLRNLKKYLKEVT